MRDLTQALLPWRHLFVTHLYSRYASFLCELYVRHDWSLYMAHFYVRHDSSPNMTCIINRTVTAFSLRNVTHSYDSRTAPWQPSPWNRDSFILKTWLIHIRLNPMWDMPHSHIRHTPSLYKTWLINRTVTAFSLRFFCCEKHDSVMRTHIICAIWATTHPYVRYDSFLCETGLTNRTVIAFSLSTSCIEFSWELMLCAWCSSRRVSEPSAAASLWRVCTHTHTHTHMKDMTPLRETTWHIYMGEGRERERERERETPGAARGWAPRPRCALALLPSPPPSAAAPRAVISLLNKSSLSYEWGMSLKRMSHGSAEWVMAPLPSAAAPRALMSLTCASRVYLKNDTCLPSFIR